MQQVKDIFAIVFYAVWICVGVASIFFIYNNYNMMSSLGGQRGSGPSQMMQQQAKEGIEQEQNSGPASTRSAPPKQLDTKTLPPSDK